MYDLHARGVPGLSDREARILKCWQLFDKIKCLDPHVHKRLQQEISNATKAIENLPSECDETLDWLMMLMEPEAIMYLADPLTVDRKRKREVELEVTLTELEKKMQDVIFLNH